MSRVNIDCLSNQAALAFALLMIIFSKIVSTILEMAHRVFGLRHKGLKLMLGHLFDKVIWPRYSVRLVRMGRLNGGSISPQEYRENFIGLLCANQTPLGMKPKWRKTIGSKDAHSLTQKMIGGT